MGNWFHKNRGKAIKKILSIGAGLGGITIPLIVLGIEEFIEKYDFSKKIKYGFWVLGLPTSLILRGDPEDYGQYPNFREKIFNI